MARRGVGISKARLGKARTEIGLTQQELADRVGVHRVTLTNIENGAACSLELAERLSIALGRTREWLMGEPEHIDTVALAREALSDSLAALEESAGRLADLMDALEGRVHERISEQADTLEVKA